MSYDSLPDNIDRIDANKVSLEEFIEKYEKPYKPVIIKNTQVDWLAKDKWTLDVSKMKYYRQYIEKNVDDSPLYLFESSFGEVGFLLYSLIYICLNFLVKR